MQTGLAHERSAAPTKAAAISVQILEKETVFVVRSSNSIYCKSVWLVALRFGLSKGMSNFDEGGNFEVVTLRCKHF